MIPPPSRAPRELGGGLVLRPMRPEDAAELVPRIVAWFGESINRPDDAAGIWATDLLRGDHPTTAVEDGVVVVDTASDRIVSSCFYLRQTWLYDGIPVQMGRPELIATDPAYRGRGIVAAEMQAQHEYATLRGDLITGLTGIPVFYRTFGYEPALISRRPPWAPASELPSEDIAGADMRIRPAVEADLPFISDAYARATAGIGIVALRDEPIWRHELLIRNAGSDYAHDLAILVRGEERLGLCASVRELRHGELQLTLCAIRDETTWSEAAPVVLRHLRVTGEAAAARQGCDFTRVSVESPERHPIVAMNPSLFSGVGGTFAWYVRIGDLAAFIQRVAPAVERRLAVSAFAGYSGRVALSFYTDGLELIFERGRIARVTNLPKLSFRAAGVCLPGRTIVALTLGSRSIDEIDEAYPYEVRVNSEETRAVVDAIFPARTSAVWPIA